MDKQVVIKSNQLIEAKYKLKLEEQRFVLYMVSLVSQQDEDFKEYEISVSDFCNYTGLDKANAYKNFLKMSNSLISKTIRIQENEDIITVAWLAQTIYHGGKGTVSVSFAPRLKPYLLQLKKSFTKYKLENVLHLSSVYAIRLYELLKQYETLGSRTFELKELKQMLCADALPAYNDYFNFKSKVVIPAHKELKEKCDIYFEFEEIKQGRRVAKIKFLIYRNENKIGKPRNIAKDTNEIVPAESLQQEPKPIAELSFITEKLTDKELLSIWESANGDVELIHKRYNAAKQKRDVNNLVGFLLWAIKEPDESFEPIKSKGKSKFNNFEGRNVDFDEIERLEREKLMRGYK